MRIVLNLYINYGTIKDKIVKIVDFNISELFLVHRKYSY